MSQQPSTTLPSRIVITVGTYDGVLAGWEYNSSQTSNTNNNNNHKKNHLYNDDDNDHDDDDEKNKKVDGKLELIFASPVHTGSIRSVTIAASTSTNTTTKTPSSPLLVSESETSITTTIDSKDTQKKDMNKKKKEKMNNNENGGLRLQPGSLLSCGYDEMLRVHDFSKRLTSSGEIKTPNEYGTPICSSFAPPGGYYHYNDDNNNTTIPTTTNPSTHCIIGFNTGTIVIYKKKDWIIQHVLTGHDGGISSLAVHPSGKLALSGGTCDGKIKLWDLMKGRLAYVSKSSSSTTSTTTKSSSSSSSTSNKNQHQPITCIVWSPDQEGKFYGYAYGQHITVRDVSSGIDLLDVELPSKVNEMTILDGSSGPFVAAACNDGSLPVLAIRNIETTTKANDDDDDDDDNNNDQEKEERRAIMAIEPVDSIVAGEERFRCIQRIYGYYVATANSAGVVSIMNLQGAVNMILSSPPLLSQNSENDSSDDEDEEDEDDDDNSSSNDDETVELAVEIIDSVRLGSGARITTLATWCIPPPLQNPNDSVVVDTTTTTKVDESTSVAEMETTATTTTAVPLHKRKHFIMNNKSGGKNGSEGGMVVTMDSDTIEKARDLVKKAKKIQKRKEEETKQQKKKKGR